MAEMGHEQVLFCRNDGRRPPCNHRNPQHRVLGPALGGCRLYNYSSEADAIRDVLRLSRGMTYKAAVAGLDLGGGKAVIIGEPSIKNEALFRAFGRQVDSLGGRYVTAEDMNTTVEDMAFIRRETRWVTGTDKDSGGLGDPSPVTAWGVFHGIRACLEVVYGSPDLTGRTVAIQGLGSVGFHLAGFYVKPVQLYFFQTFQNASYGMPSRPMVGPSPKTMITYSAECDVLAPCAIGGIINRSTIGKIKAPIIAGAANNQLDDEDEDGKRIVEAGITYAPDYVINAGGLINVYAELKQLPASQAMSQATNIFDTVKRVINLARRQRNHSRQRHPIDR